ncbi:RWD repeat domain-containing protein [Xylaria bambusicola]|uniref:RWD repeat domain-containing protein n=1 Tax=Xylaria bambusicola TaxID=326684 RepID=UPI0020083AED|nr:RWD repeat domain-containing protein [Xylaria bambusicola]KAI0525336.1 RWD repeat domain-containing protein [Xylaria bambusicola]
MSDELRDEIEAINSIYGEGCLVPSATDSATYILTPPGESSSIRVEFPSDYPAAPPTVVGTNSTGQGGKKGDAARELALFCQALGNVFEPGSVCLFDAIEELARLLGEQAPEQGQPNIDSSEHVESDASRSNGHTEEQILSKEPPWIVSDPVVEMKSTFVARCAAVASTTEAESFLQHLLASDKKVRAATHNITAWRIRGPNNTAFQDCNDDGETAAGSRLLHLMQLMDLWDVMVVVTRWYGGQKLGPRRFALINQAARDSFVRAGLVMTDTTTNSKKKK